MTVRLPVAVAAAALLLFAAWLSSPYATASALVTVDFEAAPGGLNPNNYFEDGFRISPNCHYDIPQVLAVDSVSLTRALGWDSAGCFQTPPPPFRVFRSSPEVTPWKPPRWARKSPCIAPYSKLS